MYLFDIIENLINGTNISNIASTGSNGAGLFFQLSVIAAGFGLIKSIQRNQLGIENSNTSIENTKIEVPLLLDLLTEKCSLLNKLNDYEESHNQLLQQQLTSNTEVDLDCCRLLSDEFIKLHSQLDKINEKIQSEMDGLNSLPDSVINDIAEKSRLTKSLLEKNEELKLVGLDIKECQEIKIKEKELQIQHKREQLSFGKDSNTFFSKGNHSDCNTNSSINTLGAL